MSSTDWETRELESASSERLLVEIGILQQALAGARERTGVSELELQISELQKNLLAAKDFAMTAETRASERAAKLNAQVGQMLEKQVLHLQRELLVAKDFAMTAETRASERAAKLNAQAGQILEKEIVDLRRELLAAKDFAMGAASRAGEAQAQVTAHAGQLGASQARVLFLSKHINRMRNSTTWKLGRFMMLPVRVVKKITGKSV